MIRPAPPTLAEVPLADLAKRCDHAEVNGDGEPRLRGLDEAGAAGLAFASDGEHRHYGFYPSDGRLRLARFSGPDVARRRATANRSFWPFEAKAPGGRGCRRESLENSECVPYLQGIMVPRRLHHELVRRLEQVPAVVLLGSRQVGKTTLARALEVGKPTHYVDLERPSDLAKLADPELYLSGFRDHLVIVDEVQVLGHPVCGASWEGYCIEQILDRLPRGWTASHYRTHAGAEVDLVIEDPGGNILAVEIKRTLSPKLTPGMIESMQTLRAERGVIVIPEGEAYPLSQQVEAIGLIPFLDGLA
jgi:hypothetical protein